MMKHITNTFGNIIFNSNSWTICKITNVLFNDIHNDFVYSINCLI